MAENTHPDKTEVSRNTKAIEELRTQISLASRQCGLLQDVIERAITDTNAAFKQLNEKIVTFSKVSEQDRKQFTVFKMEREEQLRKQNEITDKLFSEIANLNMRIDQSIKARMEENTTLNNKIESKTVILENKIESKN